MLSFNPDPSTIKYLPSSLVSTASGQTFEMSKAGDLQCSNGDRRLKIGDVSYAPDFQTNLLSVAKMTDRNNFIIYDKGKCLIFPPQSRPELNLDQSNAIIVQKSKESCILNV